MELKSYQQLVLNDLSLYLQKVQETKNISTAFSLFWNTHPRTPLIPSLGAAIEPYKNNVKNCPHVCIKVPTAGGKTFIASNAINTIYSAFDDLQTKAVVWLVPSVTILEQTIKNLSDPQHPYRQKINTYFQNRVEVYDKEALLNGSNFNPSSVKENLSIFVLSFDSLRAKKKEDRKVYQENGNLQSFSNELPNDEAITLMRVLQLLNPVVIVDESHNAETELSIEMLTNLNPSFILDLTATPRNNSNIISFVNAFELKKESMVKLPVIVYNQSERNAVIYSAIKMQKELENEANKEEKNGGKYIRPIVLFQAQPKNNKDNTTFEKIKELLIKCDIPENQIKIKTATINEIKGIDLMSKDCEVRYIITINALKEGWDCPFAYILASLADKSSAVDVEQILGRILRQPYVKEHHSPLLNMSYVLTASSKFNDTLENIVKGLNKAGFSSKDYRVIEPTTSTTESNATIKPQQLNNLFSDDTKTISNEDFDDVDIQAIRNSISIENKESYLEGSVATIKTLAMKESEELNRAVKSSENSEIAVPSELATQVKDINIKEIFLEDAKLIKIPQFYYDVELSDIFGNHETLLVKEILLENFPLDKASIDIDFSNATTEMYKVDLDTTKTDSTPTYIKLDGKDRDILQSYLASPNTTTESKIKTLSKQVKQKMGSMIPIPDTAIDAYLVRIFREFTNEQYSNFIDNLYAYSEEIKKKIKSEANSYAKKRFYTLIDKDKIILKPTYSFPKTINPISTIDYLPKSLYEKEGSMNKFEKEIINEVGNMPNVLFWTRNLEYKGLSINGFINHYPDFIIVTKKGKVIILETKGDHLIATEKITLGKTWESKAGIGFKYFLVYDNLKIDGAYTKNEFLDIIREL